MTDPADLPPFRHSAVYRTVRGLALSGGRTLPGTGQHAGTAALVPAAPLRVSTVLHVRPISALAASVMPIAPEPDDAAGNGDADGLFDAASSNDARRYSEPND